ncbi:MAG: hypothetical protein GKR89_05625 [Candidatus Latescibacteria bacterium]|nr:hypothetical protein [Candidatus Latescibacterota bacterium]
MSAFARPAIFWPHPFKPVTNTSTPVLPLPFRLILLSLLLLPAAIEAQQQEGYRLLSNQILVEEAGHWGAWQAPDGVRLIDEAGQVEPRFLRRTFNAARNAHQFEYVASINLGGASAQEDTLQGGIRTAGTNLETAPLILDGDMSTYWEPDPQAPVDDWSLEIDLARTLVIDRVVVRFAEEGAGDPFLKFRVLISDGLEFGRGEEGRRRQFYRVGLVTKPNKDQRTFVFDVEPQRPVAADITGEIAQFIRIDVLDSDGDRAEAIDQATYEALPEEDRGVIDYFRLTSGRRQILVGQETYQLLPADEQGPVVHYRRERPRLAEVEVYALGENIVSLTQRGRERGLDESGSNFVLFQIFTDGLYSSQLPMRTYNPFTDRNQVSIDLGAKYWLERIKLLSPAGPPPVFQIRVSDGALNPDGEFIWTTFDERRNQAGYQHVEEAFPVQEVRYIEARRLEFSGSAQEEGNLSEIQAYGEGFVSEVVMQSPFIRLDRPRLFNTVEWEGEAPPNTRIEVRTRSGDEIIEIPHYFAITGREISRSLWERIPANIRPEVVIEEVPGTDWSNWSEPYLESGQVFKSPSPRSLALVEVKLLSDEPLRSASIQRLRLRFGPPLVDKVVGEIWPARGIDPGEERDFTLYMRPIFGPGNPGFDRVRLVSSSVAPIELTSVRALPASGPARNLWPGPMEVEPQPEGDVVLNFPDPVVRQGETYAIAFRTKVFLQSTTFRAELTRQTRPGSVQPISAGDASRAIPTQSLVVVSELKGSQLLDELSLEPRVFTPNGDGINDETVVKLTVFHLEGDKRLEVEIRDLAGRRVRDLGASQTRPSGEHFFSWDGRDEHGSLVPPGTYIVRAGFSTHTQADGTRAVRLVHLVY